MNDPMMSHAAEALVGTWRAESLLTPSGDIPPELDTTACGPDHHRGPIHVRGDGSRVCHGCGAEVLPPRARHTDPTTSHMAAASLSDQGIATLRALILQLLRAHGPLTDEQLLELAAGAGSPSGLRTRRSELVRDGLVIPAGYGTTRAGRRCLYWAAPTETALEAIR